MLLDSVTTSVKPAYWQFYLCRGGADWRADEVSAVGYERHLESMGGFVYVGTSTYGCVTEVTVELYDSEPPSRRESDHIAEVPLAGDGRIEVVNWTHGDDPVAVVTVPDGPLRVRGHWSGVAAAENHPDRYVPGDTPSPERILFQIWPARPSDAAVLKAWPWKDS